MWVLTILPVLFLSRKCPDTPNPKNKMTKCPNTPNLCFTLEDNNLYIFYKLDQSILLTGKYIESLLLVFYHCKNFYLFFNFNFFFLVLYFFHYINFYFHFYFFFFFFLIMLLTFFQVWLYCFSKFFILYLKRHTFSFIKISSICTHFWKECA